MSSSRPKYLYESFSISSVSSRPFTIDGITKRLPLASFDIEVRAFICAKGHTDVVGKFRDDLKLFLCCFFIWSKRFKIVQQNSR